MVLLDPIRQAETGVLLANLNAIGEQAKSTKFVAEGHRIVKFSLSTWGPKFITNRLANPFDYSIYAIARNSLSFGKKVVSFKGMDYLLWSSITPGCNIKRAMLLQVGVRHQSRASRGWQLWFKDILHNAASGRYSGTVLIVA